MAGHIRQCSHNFTRNAYILKLDISGYFMAINRHKLLDRLLETMDGYAKRPCGKGKKKWNELLDYNLMKYLLQVVVLNDPTQNCVFRGKHKEWEGLPPSKSLFHSAPGCGLPIGNLTSQLFSNVFMMSFDQYMKREEGLHYYGRYVDDFISVHTHKQLLVEVTGRIDAKLWNDFGLRLHPQKRYLQHVTKGVDFLGMKQRRNALCVVRKYAIDCMKELSPAQVKRYQSQINSYFGLLRHCCGFHIRMRMAKVISDTPFPYLLPDDECSKVVIAISN